jgi:hypothetical protein
MSAKQIRETDLIQKGQKSDVRRNGRVLGPGNSLDTFQKMFFCASRKKQCTSKMYLLIAKMYVLTAEMYKLTVKMYLSTAKFVKKQPNLYTRALEDETS